MKALLGLAILQAFGVVLSLLLFPSQTETFFFWKIAPPANALLLGVLYTSTVIFCGQALWRGRWETARYLVPMLTYSSTMLTVVTFVHLDKFIPGLKLGAWLASYILVPTALVWYYRRNQVAGGTWQVKGQAVRSATRFVALMVGALLLALSLAALVWPAPFAAASPWPMSPLIVRAFASIWGAFGMGPLWFARERDWSRVYPVADLLTLMPAFWLLIVALYPHDPAIAPASTLPLVAFLVLVLAGGVALRMLQGPNIGGAAASTVRDGPT